MKRLLTGLLPLVFIAFTVNGFRATWTWLTTEQPRRPTTVAASCAAYSHALNDADVVELSGCLIDFKHVVKMPVLGGEAPSYHAPLRGGDGRATPLVMRLGGDDLALARALQRTPGPDELRRATEQGSAPRSLRARLDVFAMALHRRTGDSEEIWLAGLLRDAGIESLAGGWQAVEEVGDDEPARFGFPWVQFLVSLLGVAVLVVGAVAWAQERRARRDALAKELRRATPSNAAVIDVGRSARAVRWATRAGIATAPLWVVPALFVPGALAGVLPVPALVRGVLVLGCLAGGVAALTWLPWVRLSRWSPVFAVAASIAMLWLFRERDVLTTLSANPGTLGILALEALVAIASFRGTTARFPELGLGPIDLTARPRPLRPGWLSAGKPHRALGYLVGSGVLYALGAIVAVLLYGLTKLLSTVLPLVPSLSYLLGPRLVRPLMHGGSRAARLRRRYQSPGARDVMARDTRPQVLLLRSFLDDEMILEQEAGFTAHLYQSDVTFEEAITDQLWGFGPVVAIGRPGEEFPLSGAAREYVSDHSWKHRVDELAGSARLIVVILGATAGLGWELDTLVSKNLLSKVVLVIPPLDEAEVQRRLGAIREAICTPSAAALVEAACVPGVVAATFHGSHLVILRADRRDRYVFETAVDLCARASHPPVPEDAASEAAA